MKLETLLLVSVCFLSLEYFIPTTSDVIEAEDLPFYTNETCQQNITYVYINYFWILL